MHGGRLAFKVEIRVMRGLIVKKIQRQAVPDKNSADFTTGTSCTADVEMIIVSNRPVHFGVAVTSDALSLAAYSRFAGGRFRVPAKRG